ncbi:unnamed protein product, partial [marine sediment metagenome]
YQDYRTEESIARIKAQWELRKHLLSPAEQEKTLKYFANIGIEIGEVKPEDVTPPEPKKEGGLWEWGKGVLSGIQKWGQKKGEPVHVPEGTSGAVEPKINYSVLSEDELKKLVLAGDQLAIKEAKERGY